MDVGYFGPDSVTWRVHREPTALVGGLRALILQALYPPAMQLMARTSNFADDPWLRLQGTAQYVAEITFGTSEEADAAAARVRRIHAGLGIDDPDMLRWVHACEVDSFLAASASAGLGLSRTEEDRYVHEQAEAACLVGLNATEVPADRPSLDAYFRRIRPDLRATAEARRATRVVIAPPIPAPTRLIVPARVGWSAISALAVGLLPGWARRLYGLPPIPGSRLATAGGMRSLRMGMRMLPEHVREGPTYRRAKLRLAG
ncbi:MAG: DUF2236 domain-containing protein [Actinobacteria bacterium]|nr:DUF2236 domain-containing protein [Actinomycetota bacterium]